MKILVVNPNTTAAMTAKIAAAARGVAAPGTQIIAVNPPPGTAPASIEGYADEAMCVPALMNEVAQRPDVNAVVVACFDDTGVDACRVITTAPVIGICEAAMMTASVVAARFSVVTTVRRAVPVIEDLAERYGMARRCRRVRAADIPVLALEDNPDAAREAVRREVLAAVAEDGAEAVILGCAGMADLAASLSDEAGLPVIDGVVAAVKIAEAFAGLGLRTSPACAYAPPPSA